MQLRQLQSQFVFLVARLVIAGRALGYEFTFGEAYRSPEEAERLANEGKGIRNSLHTLRLAIDLNLFINGKYQTTSSAYQTLGEIWELYSTEEFKCAWGGRFNDGNHFSIEYGGRK